MYSVCVCVCLYIVYERLSLLQLLLDFYLFYYLLRNIMFDLCCFDLHPLSQEHN
jgi:hypothetical protein